MWIKPNKQCKDSMLLDLDSFSTIAKCIECGFYVIKFFESGGSDEDYAMLTYDDSEDRDATYNKITELLDPTEI